MMNDSEEEKEYEAAPAPPPTDLRTAFQQLCVQYEDVLDEATEMTHPVDERLGLALFKIDEAMVVADLVRQEAAESQDHLIEALVKNCQELEDIFIRINLIESFVAKVHAATKELERRTEAISKASTPVFNNGGVSTLLRSLSIKRPTAEEELPAVKWEPLDLAFNAPAVLERLDRSNADELGLLDADGRVTAAADAILRDELRDERLAVVTMMGPHATSALRRRLVADLLQHPAATDDSSPSNVSLVACVSFMDEDYRLLIIDVSESAMVHAAALTGVLSSLSSVLLMATTDSSQPAFLDPLYRQLLQLQRDLSPIEVFELMPSLLALDFARFNRSMSPSDPETPPPELLADVVRLKTLGTRRAVDVSSLDVGSFFKPIARVKRLFGIDLTAEMLLALLQSAARDVSEGHDPDLCSSWDEVVERKCMVVADDAKATYVDCMYASVRETPPMEMAAMEKLHDELWRLAMDVYHDGTKTFRAPSRRAVRARLKSELRQAYRDEMDVLRAASLQYCQHLRSTLWQEISALAISPSDEESRTPREAVSAMLDAVRSFDDTYASRARGPEKATVLQAFYRDDATRAFERLELILTKQMTDSHLLDLRQQLEKEFEGKKAALMDHFKQEEAQLRVCMAREMEMMQKLHQAKTSRARIDESETKRLREEIASLKARNSELERQQVALEHSSSEAIHQRTVLTAKVEELEESVRQEMANRAELVDALAATIKSAEAKETQLQERISELEIDVRDKASRIEGELRELRVQLRKTTEEKDELQKKLNEFFLRVTALPPALQQQLFCGENGGGEKVGFADALATFMTD
ncbi:hypothetical protein ATCC90586_007764 [Pythium insidiosum]|nr:hypothetical protein ATCC90586_007764 [Pythium insidiosum]